MRAPARRAGVRRPHGPGRPAMSNAAALAVEEIVAGYGGVTVLDGVSISAKAGTITAVLGANGAGKTTLLRTISGFVRPRHGRILVGGTNLARRRPEDIARAGVAHVPEGQRATTHLPVHHHLPPPDLPPRAPAPHP